MSVDIPIPITTISQSTEKTSQTYKIDFENGRIIGRVNGIEAINQAIRKIMSTPRFKCLIYSNQYGSEIKDLVIATDISYELIETMIPRFIEDALKVDTRILSVYDFVINFKEDTVYISFKVDTILGTTDFEGVI